MPLGCVLETIALLRFNDFSLVDAGPMSGFPLKSSLKHIKDSSTFNHQDVSYAKEALHIVPLTSSLSF